MGVHTVTLAASRAKLPHYPSLQSNTRKRDSHHRPQAQTGRKTCNAVGKQQHAPAPPPQAAASCGSNLQPDRYRAVVEQLDLHIRAKNA